MAILARWQATIVDDAGNIQPGASVEVRREEPGLPLVTIYSDRDGTMPLGNPMTADSEGFAAFHVLGGAYRITATKNGFSRVWRYVGIGNAGEQDGIASGVRLRFNDDTADSNPGEGYLKFNNADLASVTEIHVSDLSFLGFDISAFIDTFDDGGVVSNRGLLTIQSANEDGFFVCQITGSVAVDGSPSTYRTLSVTPLAFSEATFLQDDIVGIAFNQAGGGLAAPVGFADIQQINTQRLLGRSTAGTGVIEQLTLSQVLDLIGSAAWGDILYRGQTAWARLAAGTAGQILRTQGAGANPQWVDPPLGWEDIEAGSVSGAASFDFPLGDYDIVKAYIAVFVETDGRDLLMRMSNDGGSSFLSGAGDYKWGADWGGSGVAASGSDTKIEMNGTDTLGNAASEGYWLELTFHRFNQTGNYKAVHGRGTWARTDGQVLNGGFGGVLLDNTNVVDAIQILPNTGNVTATWHVEGRNIS